MFDCVMLAAGASSRMSGKGGFELSKPLLAFGDSTLVETAAASALEAGCRVLLVIGHRKAEVAALFSAEAYGAARAEGALLLVDNPRWETGMLSSIQAALPMTRGEAFFIAHADMPFVAVDAYRALEAERARRLSAGLPEAAMIASHEGRPGHPVLIPSSWIPGILGLDPGEGLKPFLAGKARAPVEAGPGTLRDVDTPEEYAAAML